MSINEEIALRVLSPLDGRYSTQVGDLRSIFSEFGLFKHRVLVEIRWLQQLSVAQEIAEIPLFDQQTQLFLEDLIENFSLQDALEIKALEKVIRHDVKAVEYFLKKKLAVHPPLKNLVEYLHFACTSEDINNLAYALMLQTARIQVLLPRWDKVIGMLKGLARRYRDLPMLARTHGQPASPTTLGKELANVVYRLMRQYQQLQKIPILGKMNGAVGNYNAHVAAYPTVDWLHVSEQFITGLQLTWAPYTTQIEPHDYLSEFFQIIQRFNTILLDISRDLWGYIALDYFKQRSGASEVGSSTMPHKINPIDFENCEGNLGLANTICHHFSTKLPISRWQRDLSDSTVLRNLGVGIGYAVVAYQAFCNGLDLLEVNSERLAEELTQQWVVLTEAIQTVMRRYKIEAPYEQLKQMTRGKVVSQKILYDFIETLPLPLAEKQRLQALTPGHYTGLAPQLVDHLLEKSV